MSAAPPVRLHGLARYLWEPAALGAVLLVLAVLVRLSGDPILNFTMTNTLIQMVLVIGLYVFIGNSGILAFGHISYAMIGAYAVAWLTMPPFKKGFALDLPPFLAEHSFPMLPSALAAMGVASLAALVTCLPLVRMNEIAFSIGTFAVLVIIKTVYSNWDSWTFGASTLVGIPIYVTVWVALGAVAAALLVATVYQKSRFGLALRASREDDVAAHAVGIHVGRERLIGFALSGLFMGAGGVLQAHFLGSIAVSAFWIPQTFILIAMLMIGGQRSLTGAVVGTFVVSLMTAGLRQLEAGLHFANSTIQVPYGLSELGLALLMLLVLTFRNTGLSGGREIPYPFGDGGSTRYQRAQASVRVKAGTGAVGGGGVPSSKLEARDITVRFGGLVAISGVTLSVSGRKVTGLIGPNGAGKTTLINVLTGFQRPAAGSVVLDGEDITGLGPIARTNKGLSRSFQAVRLFRDMTVLENLEVAGIGMGLSRAEAVKRAWDILVWMKFEGKAHTRAETLPYGDERRVGLARVLATAPRFAIFDEPAAGMTDAECDSLMHLIAEIPARFNCGVLLIEHNMRVVMGVCERIHVIDSGRTIAEGVAGDIKTNADVIRAYLGSKPVKVHA